jgi:hypothetical protein
LAVLNQLLEFFPHPLFLTSVPHLNVFHFGETESSFWVFYQLISDSGKNRPHWGMIGHLIWTCIILIDSLLKSQIGLSSWNQVNCEIPLVTWLPFFSINMLPGTWELSLILNQ